MEKLLKQLLMCIKSRGVNILICIVYRISSLCYVLMLKLWVKLSKKNFVLIRVFLNLAIEISISPLKWLTPTSGFNLQA